MRRLLLGLMLVVGCGSEDDGNPLAATRWSMTVDSACAIAVGFETETAYRALFGCTLTDGTFGANVEDGVYTASGDLLQMYPRAATCPTDVSAFTYAVTPTTLTLSNSSGVLLFSKLPPGSGTGVINFGCFAADGTFTPSPLTPL